MKKIFSVILAVIIVAAAMFALTACKETEDPESKHVHDLHNYPATDATCYSAGNIEYWFCEGCDKYFSDAEGTKEIDGTKTSVPTKNHNANEVGSTPPDCVRAGNIMYYYCDNCKSYYRDAKCTQRITLNQTVILPYLNYAINSEGNGYEVVGYNGEPSVITVPAEYNKLPVVGIASGAFSGCGTLTDLTVPDEVTVAKGALRGCIGLQRLDIERLPDGACLGSLFGGDGNTGYVPEPLTSVKIRGGEIAEGAFRDCNTLKNIDLDGVTGIGFGAFDGCSALQKLTVPFVGTSATASFHLGYLFGAKYYIDNADYVPATLTDISVTGGSYISKNAFFGFDNLEKISLPFTGERAVPVMPELNSPVTGPIVSNSHFGYIFGATSYKDNSRYVPSGLREVEITDMPLIDFYAFFGCSGIRKLTFSRETEYVGTDAFGDCSIEEFTASSIAIKYLEDKGALKKAVINGGSAINDGAFANCTALTVIEIYEGITEIGSGAFDGCTALEEFRIYDMESYCRIRFKDEKSNPMCYASKFFLGGQPVTNLNISDTIRSIGSYAFANFKALKTVTMPEYLNTVGAGAFLGCELNSVTIKDVEKWAAVSFGDINANPIVFSKAVNVGRNTLTSLNLDVKEVKDYAFGNCAALTSVTVNAEAIGDRAFFGCAKLSALTLGKKVASIGDLAFGNTALATITVDGDNKAFTGKDCVINQAKNIVLGAQKVVLSAVDANSIDKNAFYGNTALKTITIPQNILSVESKAFYGCRNLAEIIIESNIIYQAEDVFEACNAVKTAKVHASAARLIPKAALTSVTVYGTDIGERAFYGCTALTSLTLDAAVRTIGASAFGGCVKLTSVTLPIGITQMGANAFGGCDAITTASVSADFVAYIPKTALTTVTIIGGEAIPDNAFDNCGTLKKIELSGSVKSIGRNAFKNCISLQEIVYVGTEDAWLHVTKDIGWDAYIEGQYRVVFK